MDHIVVITCPFTIEQNVSVYHNGECIKNTKCNINNLADTCYNLCKEYNIHQLDVKGQKLYIMHLLDELKFTTKYKNFNVDINIY